MPVAASDIAERRSDDADFRPLPLDHGKQGRRIGVDLPRTLDRLWGNFPSYWTCPERWTAYGGISRPMTPSAGWRLRWIS